jgi:hypothetical protein
MIQLITDLSRKIVPLLVIIGLTFAMGCSTDSDPEPEPPVEPAPIEREGTKELTVTVIDRAEESGLSGFDIEITGPVSASAQNVSATEYVLEDLVSGEYTIEVTLDGYVEASLTEEFEVPEDASADYLAETTVSLRVLTPPVKVNNSEPSTVKTGKADTEDATEEDEVTLQIKANTFPAEVVNADGTVDISVTRARPSQSTAGESGGQVSESLILTPAAELNDTVTVTIPARDIEGLEDVEYVLQPGNIPLTRTSAGKLTAKIASHVVYNANLDIFRRLSRVATNVEVVKTSGTSSPVTFSSACGEPLNRTYSKSSVIVPAAISLFSTEAVLKSAAFSKQIQLDAVPDRIVTVRVTNPTKTYTLTANGNQAATVTLNEKIVTVSEPTAVACHGSN